MGKVYDEIIENYLEDYFQIIGDNGEHIRLRASDYYMFFTPLSQYREDKINQIIK
jgi:hypothetical protein